MSLGGARNDGGGAFLLDNAIDNLDRANMVVAVAAGQRRSGLLHRPLPRRGAARAHRGREHGRPQDHQHRDRRRHSTTRPSSATSRARQPTSPRRWRSCPIRAALPARREPRLRRAVRRCRGIDLTGKIALLGRGDCDFTVKMRNAQNAGAVGVIMVNRSPGEAPFVMAHNGLEPQPTIPGFMVSLEDGAGDRRPRRAAAQRFTRSASTSRARRTPTSWPASAARARRTATADQARRRRARVPTSSARSPPGRAMRQSADYRLLGVLRRYVDGHAAPRRSSGGRPRRPSRLERGQVRSAVINTAQQNVLQAPRDRSSSPTTR